MTRRAWPSRLSPLLLLAALAALAGLVVGDAPPASASDGTTTPAPNREAAVELPGPVTGLDLTVTAEGAVTVSWQAPDTGGAPKRYIVHLKPEGGKQGSGKTKRPKAKKTTVTFDNLESGATYRVWVRAQNAAGKGERVHSTITLPQAEPPPQETILPKEITPPQELTLPQKVTPPEEINPPEDVVPPDDGGGQGQGTDQAVKQGDGQGEDQTSDQGEDQGTDQAVKQGDGQGNGQGEDQTSDQGEDQGTDQAVKQGDGQGNDQAVYWYTLLDVGQEQDEDQDLEPALVSNFGQERRRLDWPTNNYVLAQGFTTGNADTTLEGIEVSIRATLHAGHVATVRAELWSAAAGGEPGSKLVDLVVPDVVAKGRVAFAAPPDTVLSADTTYHFVLYTTGRVDLRVVNTFSVDEDAGGEHGWSISDLNHYIRAQTPEGRSWVEESVDGIMLMRVNGGDQPGQ